MSTWSLGIRLALQANRVRLVVTAVAVSFAVAFLLGAMGALPARQAKLDRLDARRPVSVAQPAEVTPAEGLLVRQRTGWYRGRPLTVVDVRGTAPRPPGVGALPRLGEAVVSPELAAALRGPHRSELSTRVPGRVVGTITETGLSGPHELFAYVGADLRSPSDVRGVAATDFGQVVDHYGGHQAPARTPRQLRIAAWLGTLGLLLPVLVLVATATRLSAASRDRRLAALRLVGATPQQARSLAAADGLVAGSLGVAGGVLLFLLVRGPACALLPFPEGVYAQDLWPGARSLTAVLVGVPLLSVATAVFALRRVVTSPLGVNRQARVRTAGWWRLLPLAVGLVLLFVLRLRGGGPVHHVDDAILLGGGGLTLVGIAFAAPALSRLSGALLGRLPGVSVSLAARRIALDPGASARVVTGMVLVVFVAGWLLAFLPVLKSSQEGNEEQLLKLVPRGTVVAYLYRHDDASAVSSVKGVGHVLVLRAAMVRGPGSETSQVDVVSCRDLATFVGADIGCTSAKVHSTGIVGPAMRGDLLLLDPEERVVARLRTPASPPLLQLPMAARLGGLLQGAVVIDPGLVPAVATAALPGRLVVTTDGHPDTVEAVRGALPASLAVEAATLEERLSSVAAVYLGYQRAVRIGLVLAVLVAAASLAVTTADTVNERRRGLSALVALGTPSRVLRRSVLLQMAGPLVTNVLAALAAAAVASECYLSLYDEPHALPWGGWALTAAGAGVAVLLATATTLPLVSAVARPEGLRAE
ncbi:MAG: FtsX-like permease family protein [Mycobacteriales bacterium]